MILAKRRRALKTRVQQEGTLSLEKSKTFIASKTNRKYLASVENENSNPSK